MKQILKSLIAPLAFLVSQSVGGALMMVAALAMTLILSDQPMDIHSMSNGANIDTPMWLIALTVVITGAVTVAFLSLMKMIDWRNAWKRSALSAGWCSVAVLGTVSCIVTLNLLSEQVELPNLMEEQMLGMSSSIVGMAALAVLGPIVEELVFREAMMGTMLRGGVSPLVAILVSAGAFGLIHVNPAQIPFAACIGIVFGIIYWRTRNILLTTALHIANNSTAVLMMAIWGEESKDITFTQLLGSPLLVWGIVAASGLLGIALMYRTAKGE